MTHTPHNLAVPTPPGSMFDLKFHHFSIYHADPAVPILWWKEAGYPNWIHDYTLLSGTEYGEPMEKYEDVWFNYDLWPHEFEYIRYSNGRFSARDARDGSQPFISHWATFVDNVDDTLEDLKHGYGLEPYTKYTTVKHQNPSLLANGQRFYQCLFDTKDLLGYDLKIMQRLWPGDEHYPANQPAPTVGH